MKIITLHCDYIKFKALKKALKDAEELSDKDEKSIKECLVILTAVEKGDSPDTISQLIQAIEKTAKDVKSSNIVLYPYAHLSSNLAPPKVAQQFLQDAEKLIKKNKSFKSVVRAPFGYYKSFELKVKGHPLSELSKTFRIDSSSSSAEVEEEYDIKKLLSEVSRTKLDTSKLKENDHRILAQKLDLFSFNESAPGSVFWHDNGLYIYNKLVEYWRNIHRKAGYQEISTPQVVDNKLWKISGHWKLYKDNLFITNREGREFALKPMNCPGGMMVYKSQPKSYRDLPLRFAELGKVHRLELSGVISGIFRVFQFTQDDAHIFVSEKQLQSEIVNVIKLFKEMLDIFNFKYNFTLSVRSKDKKEKYLGGDKLWVSAEQALTDGLNKLKIKYSKEPGEAKFYGPSLDVVIKDSLGREWQCSTLQLDFNLPERFDLEYIDKDNKPKRPIILHRVVYGSLERFIGVLLEHTNGNLPLWFSPRQVRVVSFTDRNIKATEKLVSQLKESLPGLRIDSDNRSETVQSKIRDAEMLKINYVIVIGDKEEKSKTLAIRPRGEKPKFNIKLDSFIKDLEKELTEHHKNL